VLERIDLTTEFNKDWQEESRKHAATTIRNEVKDWTGSKATIALKRWIWELLQNAIDTARDNGITELEFEIFLKDGNLTIRHNGGKFLLKEIIAIVSGGTSKYFGRETLGKFGKGFLVTHVISRRTSVEGWVSHKGTTKPFRIQLDRSSQSEEDIEKNIVDCAKQLSDESAIGTLEKNNTSITYLGANAELLESALSQFPRMIPYIMVFNASLRTFSVSIGENRRVWKREQTQIIEFGKISFERVEVSTPDQPLYGLKAVEDQVEVAILLTANSPSVVKADGTPSIFHYLPLHESEKLNTCYAINSSKFTVDTDRGFIEETDNNSKLLSLVPKLVGELVEFLVQREVKALEHTARMDLSQVSPDERRVFLGAVWENIPKILSTKLIVECPIGRFTPLASHFPTGDYLGTLVSGLSSHLHAMISQCFDSVPKSFADWESITREWSALQFHSLDRYSLETIIATFPDLLSRLAEDHRPMFVASVLKALIIASGATKSLPENITQAQFLLNQSSGLVAPQVANVDLGVTDALKNIAPLVGWNIRDYLIDDTILRDEGIRKLVNDYLCAGREQFSSKLVSKRLWESYVSTKWKESQDDPKFRTGLLQFVIWLTLNVSQNSDKFLDPDNLPILCNDNTFRTCADLQSYPFL